MTENEQLTRQQAALDTDARELLFDLVETPSVSGEEAAAADVLHDFLADHGRDVWIDDVGNVRAPAPETEQSAEILLTSHIDTVPGDVPVEVETVASEAARWGGAAVTKADEAGSTAEVPELWGRGSVDATGSLAAMAAAAVETDAAFVGVVGEETDSRGARHLVEDRAAPAAVVNGEPSGWDAVTLGYRGFLSGTYTVRTESTHTSRPEPNAIQHATDWWERVESVFESAEQSSGESAAESAEKSADESVFESVTIKPVSFDGGLTDDGHAVEATVEAQFRIPPDESAAAIRQRVESVTDSGAMVWDEPIPPTMASPRTVVARAFRVEIREAGGDPRLLRKTGTADANLYAAAWDAPVVTYGPGDAELDHTPEERLPLPELDRAAGVLSSVVERLR